MAPVAQNEALIHLLKERWPRSVAIDDSSCMEASFDALRIASKPDAVLSPEVPEMVGEVLCLANEHKIPVTVRGAGSSTTGSAVPIKGGWVLDLSRLNQITIDDKTGMATVQAGAITGDIQKQVEARGWFYPPDPGSSAYCTIGGNIACNAGGMRCVKYGVTRDYIYALKGYLPTGELVSWGLPLKKFVSGFNVKDLWIGSEGLLGVVTEAVLKLIPRPLSRWMCQLSFSSEIKALQFSQAILAEKIVPSALEFIDGQTLDCFRLKPKESSVVLDESAKSLLLVELDGDNEWVKHQKAMLMKLIEREELSFIEIDNETDMQAWWEFRKACSKAMYSLGSTKLNEDVVVPLEKQIELVRYALALKEEIGLATPTFGHVGDGNLHVHIMYNRHDSSQKALAKKGIVQLMKKVVELGGCITGEHGIGLAKSSFLGLQHSAAEIKTMRAIKSVFDPQQILNPGKMFDAFVPWDHDIVSYPFAWEK